MRVLDLYRAQRASVKLDYANCIIFFCATASFLCRKNW
ncbi:hypothetical protein DSUL_90027 [Desulfovibrionales bacterium]